MTDTTGLISKRPRGNKFGAIKTELDGIKFDSRRESVIYAQLKVRERIGEISRLTVHPKWPLTVDGVKIADYTADFSFYDVENGRHTRLRVIDVKSKPTARKRDFVLVRKLMAAVHKIDVEVWE